MCPQDVPSDPGDGPISWPSAQAKSTLNLPGAARSRSPNSLKVRHLSAWSRAVSLNGLKQALHRALFEHLRTQSFISMSGDEDNLGSLAHEASIPGEGRVRSFREWQCRGSAQLRPRLLLWACWTLLLPVPITDHSKRQPAAAQPSKGRSVR